jgi:hypothetical protein
VAKKAAITAESLISDLDAVITGASRKDQWAAVNRAIELRGKLKGYLVDRLEVGGVGAFDHVETVEDCVKLMLADQTPAGALKTLDALREGIERHAADHADVIVAEPAWPRAPSESAQALALLRPGRR